MVVWSQLLKVQDKFIFVVQVLNITLFKATIGHNRVVSPVNTFRMDTAHVPWQEDAQVEASPVTRTTHSLTAPVNQSQLVASPMDTLVQMMP